MAKPSLTNCPKHRPSAQRPRAQASEKRQTLVVSKRIQYVTLFQAVIAPGFHLFPFRTEKLSPAAPMVLRKRESRSPPPLPEVPSTHTVRKGLRFFLDALESLDFLDVLDLLELLELLYLLHRLQSITLQSEGVERWRGLLKVVNCDINCYGGVILYNGIWLSFL